MSQFVLLTYSVDPATGFILFTYRESLVPVADAMRIKSFGDPTALNLSPPAPILDLVVYDDSYLEIWLDPDKNWRWPRALDAVTTKEDRKDLYFDLKYRDGFDTYLREEFPKNKVPMMAQFGAIHRKGKPKENHGFSLNVEFVYPDSKPLPVTIDPDIKNPSV